MRSVFGLLSVFALAACGGCAHGPEVPSISPYAGLEVVPASSERGFNYPYLLSIPTNAMPGSPPYLLVEPNNTGSGADELETHLAAAKSLTGRGIGAFVSKSLGVPLLVPVFPRPKSDWKIYTHLLDRDAMLIREGPMRRLDLQLIAMIQDAQAKLRHYSFKVREKVWLTGFSASGAFVNRFTMLHPDRVKAAASGGVNGLLMLPTASLGGVVLDYPLGLSDFKVISGATVQLKLWQTVPQFIYMGAEDQNDAVQFDDGYSADERAVVYKAIGEKMQPDRWERCQEIYRTSGAKITFKTFQGIGHGTNRQINSEIAEFFSATAGPGGVR